MGGYENEQFGRGIDNHYVSKFVEENDGKYGTREPEGDFEGMIFMSNRRTKKECLDLKLFGLPSSYASVVKHVRPGMKLFLFEHERREMHGVFEAITSGSMNIDRCAFKQSGRSFPAQVRFRRVWECYPLSEEDFKEAIIVNYRTTKEFEFDLSQDQVLKLLHLFAVQRIEPQVCEGPGYFEDGQDFLPGSDLQYETASLLQEVGRSLLTKEFCYEDPLHREDCHVGKTIYDISDAEQNLASMKKLVHNDLLARGDCHAGQIICEGDFHAGQTLYDTSDAEQRLALHSVQDFSNAGNCDQLNSEFQPLYVRFPNCTQNLRNTFVPRDIGINATYVGDKVHGDNTREVIVPSNPQNHFSLNCNETEMPCSSLSLDSLLLTLRNPVIDMLHLEGCLELKQAPRNISHVNNINDNSFLCADEFQDGLPLHFMGPPKFAFVQPRDISSGMPTLRSDNISQKPSVFSRLKRVPEIDVAHERKHGDLFREICRVKSPFHNNQRKLFSLANNELDVSNKLGDDMQEAEAGDEPIVVDGIIINFKRRSQVCKDGKQIEGQTKHSDEEPNLHKQKRRKLIRPRFDSPVTSEISDLPLSIVETVQKCNIENKVPPQPESGAHTMNRNMISVHSPPVNFQHMPLVNATDATENKNLPALGCMQDLKDGTCLPCVPVLKRSVTEHSDSGFVQAITEIENKDLVDLSVDVALSDCYEKGCPSQVVSPSTNVINAGCDCRRENRGLSAYVTGNAESRNVQAVEVLKTANGHLTTLATGGGSKYALSAASSGDTVTLTTGINKATIASTLLDDQPLAAFTVNKVLEPKELFPAAPAPAPAPEAEVPATSPDTASPPAPPVDSPDESPSDSPSDGPAAAAAKTDKSFAPASCAGRGLQLILSVGIFGALFVL